MVTPSASCIDVQVKLKSGDKSKNVDDGSSLDSATTAAAAGDLSRLPSGGKIKTSTVISIILTVATVIIVSGVLYFVFMFQKKVTFNLGSIGRSFEMMPISTSNLSDEDYLKIFDDYILPVLNQGVPNMNDFLSQFNLEHRIDAAKIFIKKQGDDDYLEEIGSLAFISEDPTRNGMLTCSAHPHALFIEDHDIELHFIKEHHAFYSKLAKLFIRDFKGFETPNVVKKWY